MKLEVGMYVRFDYHRVTIPIQISKIKEKHYEDIEKYYYYLTDNGLVISEEQIIKASHNIIDLIEVGDYVNGYLIDYIDTERRFLRSERPYREKSSWYKDLEEKGKDYNMCLHFKNEDIKSIVTKEQFSQMEYKVVE